MMTLFRIAYLEDQTTELQEGLKQVRDSLSRTLNTTDIIQVRSLMIIIMMIHHSSPRSSPVWMSGVRAAASAATEAARAVTARPWARIIRVRRKA